MKTYCRESNWELLRIVAMLMIVCGHFVVQSNVKEYVTGIELWLVDLMALGFRIAVNLFLMLGCWFMVDATFKGERVLKLALEVMFYSFSVVALLLLLGYQLKLGDIVAGIFPFTTTLWFATSYIVLLMMSPYLKKILLWKRKDLEHFLIVQFVVISVVCTVHNLMDTYLCTIIWFEFIYLAIGYYKKYHADSWFNKKKAFALGVGGYVLLVSCIVLLESYHDMGYMHRTHDVLIRFLVDYKSVPNFFISFMIFIFFQKLSLGNEPWINKLAMPAFAVYLVHQGPGIQHPLWFDFYKSDYVFLAGCFSPVLYVIFVPISCYFLVWLVDHFRRKYIESKYIESRPFKYFSKKVNDFYSNNS